MLLVERSRFGLNELLYTWRVGARGSSGDLDLAPGQTLLEAPGRPRASGCVRSDEPQGLNEGDQPRNEKCKKLPERT